MRRGRRVASQPVWPDGYEPALPVGATLPMPNIAVRLSERQLRVFNEDFEESIKIYTDDSFKRQMWRIPACYNQTKTEYFAAVENYRTHFSEEVWTKMVFNRHWHSRGHHDVPPPDPAETNPEILKDFQKVHRAYKPWARAAAEMEALKAAKLLNRLFEDDWGENIAAFTVWALHHNLNQPFDIYGFQSSYCPDPVPCTAYHNLEIRAGDRFYFHGKVHRYFNAGQFSGGWIVIFEITAHRVFSLEEQRRWQRNHGNADESHWYDPNPIARFYTAHALHGKAWKKVTAPTEPVGAIASC